MASIGNPPNQQNINPKNNTPSKYFAKHNIDTPHKLNVTNIE